MRRTIKTAAYRAWLQGWLGRWVVQSWLCQHDIAAEDVRGVEWTVRWFGGEMRAGDITLFVQRGRRVVALAFDATDSLVVLR
jgi:hypothetical protein